MAVPSVYKCVGAASALEWQLHLQHIGKSVAMCARFFSREACFESTNKKAKDAGMIVVCYLLGYPLGREALRVRGDLG